MGSVEIILISEANEVFRRLSNMTTDVTDTDIRILEKYVVMLYSRISQETGVYGARKQHFSCQQKLELYFQMQNKHQPAAK